LACLGSVATAGHARADGLPISLHWTRAEGAESCIGPIEVAQRIEARAGRTLFEPAGNSELALEGHVSRVPEGGYRVRLLIVDAHGAELGARELSSADEDCRALDAAVTLVIYVTLYPEGGLDGSGIALPADVAALLGAALHALDGQAPPDASSASHERIEPVAELSPPEQPPLVELEPRPTRAVRVRVTASGIGVAGVSPDATLGAELALALVPPSWPMFELSGAVLSEVSSSFSTAMSEATLRVSASRFGLVGCTDADDRSSFELRGCFGAEALVTSASTEGLMQDGDALLVAPSVLAGARAALWLGGGFGLSAGLRLAAPLMRSQLQVQARTGVDRSVYQLSAVNFGASFGVSWQSGGPP
jgi:hypothetical protein